MHGSMHSDASMIFSTSPDSTIDLPLIISEDEDEEEFEAELGCLSEIALEHNTAVATVLSTVLVGRKVQYRQQPAAMVEAEVVKLSAMPGGNTEAKSGASESPRHGCQLTLRLTDGTLVESSPSHVLPAEEAIAAAEGTEMPQPRSHGLNDLAIFIVARSERAALEFRLRAVAPFFHGGKCEHHVAIGFGFGRELHGPIGDEARDHRGIHGVGDGELAEEEFAARAIGLAAQGPEVIDAVDIA